MKKNIKKSMMPATVAPVQRETAATVSRDGSAITPLFGGPPSMYGGLILLQGTTRNNPLLY